MKTISKEVLYLGLDVHAENVAVAIAEAGRDGEVRNYGEIPNTFHSVDKLMRKLGHPDNGRMSGIFPFQHCARPARRRQRLGAAAQDVPQCFQTALLVIFFGRHQSIHLIMRASIQQQYPRMTALFFIHDAQIIARADRP